MRKRQRSAAAAFAAPARQIDNTSTKARRAQIPSTKFQIPNKSEIQNPNDQNGGIGRQIRFEFSSIWSIGISLGFGA
jgi:hypothetical protein